MSIVDHRPTQSAEEQAVLYLRMALLSGDDARREFYLGKCIAAVADALGIDVVLNAIRIGAELHSD